MNNKVHKFSKKYEAVCRPSGQHYKRIQIVPVKFGEDPAEVLYQELPYQSVSMVEIHLPEDRFRELIEHDEFLNQYKHLQDSTTGSFLFKDMMQARAIVDQHETECSIRNQYPAVQAAYEQYLLVLNLCR